MRKFTIVSTPWFQRLRAQRTNVDGISQAELGRRLGITANPQGAVARMESGSWPEDPERQQAVADYLGEELVDLRSEINGTPIDGLEDLRALVAELRVSNAAIVDALRETNNRLADVASTLEKLVGKGS